MKLYNGLTLFHIKTILILSGITIMFCTCFIQTSKNQYPSDLKIIGSIGGVHPWEQSHLLRLTADGHGYYKKHITEDIGKPPLEEKTFQITPTQIQVIWDAVMKNDFFHLQSEYKNENITGGFFASLMITGNNQTHKVSIWNRIVPPFTAILQTLNSVTPPETDLPYIEYIKSFQQ
jgi:hypothetical protein